MIFIQHIYISLDFYTLTTNAAFVKMNENLQHLFYSCLHSSIFWARLEKKYIYILCNADFIVNLLIMYCKFRIHKCGFTKGYPNLIGFQLDLKNIWKYIDTKK